MTSGTARTERQQRPMSVSGYVEAPFGEVMAELAGPRARRVLQTAIAAGLGFGEDQVSVEVRAPAVHSGGSAQVDLTWSGDDGAGRVRGGSATVTVLLVQSGEDAITELLVRTQVDTATAPRAAAAIHRCLDELGALLS
jgi:hypothetical protein